MLVGSKIGPKGQVTIPKELREKYHLLEGEDVLVVPSAEGVLVKHPTTSLRGRLKGRIDTERLEDELKRIRKQWRVNQ